MAFRCMAVACATGSNLDEGEERNGVGMVAAVAVALRCFGGIFNGFVFNFFLFFFLDLILRECFCMMLPLVTPGKVGEAAVGVTKGGGGGGGGSDISTNNGWS